MLRPLYRWVLRLHPSGFRRRFADEMLSIFDHRVGKPAALSLLVDGLMSLARQWALRSEFWNALSPAQEPGADDIPSLLERPTVPPRWQDKTPIALSTAPHSFNASHSAPAAVAMQNRAVQVSATHASETLGSESQERAGRLTGLLSTTPVPQAPFEPYVGTHVDQPQAPQPKSQGATSAMIRAVAEDVKLDAAERQRVIDGAIANLTKYYIYPDVAQKMADALLVHEKSGDVRRMKDGSFARMENRAESVPILVRSVSLNMPVSMALNQESVPTGMAGSGKRRLWDALALENGEL